MKRLLFGLLIVLSSGNLFAQSTAYYIAPTGKDKNSGTRNKPLRTIKAATELVRKTKGKVFVYLRGGTYYLEAPVVFTAADARQPSATVTYKALSGEHVVISSSALL